MMTYQETLDYLYRQLPSFERQGNKGYKPGLQTSRRLDDLFGNPHRQYPCIHVAGTNGKGSVSHLMATTLQQCGFKVGLYTSPHIVDFRERIRVNGKMIPQEAVSDFMARYFAQTGQNGILAPERQSGEFDDFHPTFFELTSTMAMDYFSQEQVDYAVIEVGLGGRLDSTNIITPILSVITNISLDHTQFLGNTLVEIAGEKAGIIKPHVPVVVGEAQGDVRRVFERKAATEHSPIYFAQDTPLVLSGESIGGHTALVTKHLGRIEDQLGGECQVINANTALTAIEALKAQGIHIGHEAITSAFSQVITLSGLIGRWQLLRENPRVICDSGHNIGAFRHTVSQLRQEHFDQLHLLLGFMKDKDIEHILKLLPQQGTYYFTHAHNERALSATGLQAQAARYGLQGECYSHVREAYQAALSKAGNNDLIFIGGSMYVLAELGDELLAPIAKQ